MNDTARKKRKRFYVGKAVQGRLLKRFCIYWLAYHIFLVLVLLMDALLSTGHPQSLAQLCTALFQKHFWTFALLAAIFPVIFRDILKTTHRIAGPLVRFETVLRQMAHGEQVERIHLRKHDLLFELGDAFNEFIDVRNKELEASDRQDNSPPVDEQELAGCSDVSPQYSKTL